MTNHYKLADLIFYRMSFAGNLNAMSLLYLSNIHP